MSKWFKYRGNREQQRLVGIKNENTGEYYAQQFLSNNTRDRRFASVQLRDMMTTVHTPPLSPAAALIPFIHRTGTGSPNRISRAFSPDF